MPRICVIVPVYGVESYLRNCLNSLLSQTEEDYEILLINDGSIDKCPHICNEYAENFKDKVRLINQPNAGVSAARNTGLDYSDSEYVTFVDSDDTVHSNYLSELRTSILENKSDLSCCNIYKFFEKTNEIKKRRFFHSKHTSSSIKEDKTLLFSIPPSSWGKMYKRSLFTNIRFPYIKYEDLATTSKLIVKANRISFVESPLYFYTIRTGSIMSDSKLNFDILKAIYEAKIFTKESDDLKDELCFLFIKHALICRTLHEYPNIDLIKEIHIYGKNNFPKWGENQYLAQETKAIKKSLNILYSFGPYAYMAYRKFNY